MGVQKIPAWNRGQHAKLQKKKVFRYVRMVLVRLFQPGDGERGAGSSRLTCPAQFPEEITNIHSIENGLFPACSVGNHGSPFQNWAWRGGLYAPTAIYNIGKLVYITTHPFFRMEGTIRVHATGNQNKEAVVKLPTSSGDGGWKQLVHESVERLQTWRDQPVGDSRSPVSKVNARIRQLHQQPKLAVSTWNQPFCVPGSRYSDTPEMETGTACCCSACHEGFGGPCFVFYLGLGSQRLVRLSVVVALKNGWSKVCCIYIKGPEF